MSRLKILGGPDRLSFANSLFADIDSVPVPGFASRPQSRGGNHPPTYLGELFLTEFAGEERELKLIITSSKRKGGDGWIQEFTAILWADCDEFKDLLPMQAWIYFRGEINFMTQKDGWLERA